MERAHLNGATTNQLLVNHRAFAGLERLPSDLFYDGIMRSDKTDDELLPLSVRRRLAWIQGIRIHGTAANTKPSVPRLLIVHEDSRANRIGTSMWNPKHQEIVLEQVSLLLQDEEFTQVDGITPGTIMILSVYREAVHRYQGAVNRLLSKRHKRRCQVRTVDTAQGQEADVVFVDFIHSQATEHTRNMKRLCVAFTRARQAEVLVMQHGMLRAKVFATILEKCRSGVDGGVLRVEKPKPSEPSVGWGCWGPDSPTDSPEDEKGVSDSW